MPKKSASLMVQEFLEMQVHEKSSGDFEYSPEKTMKEWLSEDYLKILEKSQQEALEYCYMELDSLAAETGNYDITRAWKVEDGSLDAYVSNLWTRGNYLSSLEKPKKDVIEEILRSLLSFHKDYITAINDYERVKDELIPTLQALADEETPSRKHLAIIDWAAGNIAEEEKIEGIETDDRDHGPDFTASEEGLPVIQEGEKVAPFLKELAKAVRQEFIGSIQKRPNKPQLGGEIS